MADRAALLRSLIALDRPLREIQALLRGLSDECGRPAVSLATGDIAAMVKRHLAGEFSGAVLEGWAACLEEREDVAFPNPALRDTLDFLAHPASRGPTREEALRNLLRLLAETP